MTVGLIEYADSVTSSMYLITQWGTMPAWDYAIWSSG